MRRSRAGELPAASSKKAGPKEKQLRYAVVIEKADTSYSAYIPDLPGCVATGATMRAVRQEIRSAIRFHIEGLREDDLDVPQPTSIATYVEA